MMTSMPPRKKKDPDQPALAVTGDAGFTSPEQRPTKEYWRFVDFYNKQIRKHGPTETPIVIKNIQRLVEQGISVEDIAQALENYANDDWRKRQDPRYSKTMRAFFSPEAIREWLTPKPKPVKPIERIAKFTSDYLPPPAVVEPIDDTTPDDL